MSNQIYENSVVKYYQQTNMATFNIAAPQNFSQNVVDILIFTNKTDPQDLYSLSSGSIIVGSDGMYSFSVIIEHINSGNPQTEDNEFEASIKLLSPLINPSPVILTDWHIREAARGDDSGQDTRIITLTGTTFMRSGDSVFVNIENFVTQALTVTVVNTKCIAQKIY